MKKNDLLRNTKNGGGNSNGWESDPINLDSQHIFMMAVRRYDW